MKKFYAIKHTDKGINNVITTDWDTCKSLVYYTFSVYKGFTDINEALNWLNSIDEKELNRRRDLSKYYSDKKKKVV